MSLGTVRTTQCPPGGISTNCPPVAGASWQMLTTHWRGTEIWAAGEICPLWDMSKPAAQAMATAPRRGRLNLAMVVGELLRCGKRVDGREP